MSDLSVPTVPLALQPEEQFSLPAPDTGLVAEAGENARRDLRGLNELAEAWQSVQMQRQTVLAQAQAQDETLRLRQKTDEVIRNYETLRNKDAIDALPKVRRQLDQIAADTVSHATGYHPLVRDAIQSSTRQVIFEENSRASQHELSQTISWRDKTLNGLKQEAQDNALLYKNNPGLYAKYVNEFKDYTRQQLDNAGIPEDSDAWRAAMRDAESKIHEISIFDDIERESFGAARQKLDRERRHMDQETWLRLDRMCRARAKAWSDARAGESDSLINYFNLKHHEYLTGEEFKQQRGAILEQIKSEIVIETLKNKDGTEYIGEDKKPVFSYRPKTEAEVQSEYQRRVLRAAEDFAQDATMHYKKEKEGRTDFNKRNIHYTNDRVVEYIDAVRRSNSYPSVEGFKRFNENAYNSLILRHDGDRNAAEQELQQTLNAYYTFNPRSNAAVVAGFENFLETASPADLQAMTAEAFDSQYGSYMSVTERIANLTKLENKKRGISNGLVDDNSGLIKNAITTWFPDVVFNVRPEDYGDADTIIQSEQGRWIYGYVARTLKANPSLTADNDLTVAVANILSSPSFLMEKHLHDRAKEATRSSVRDFLESQGVDSSQAFIAWVMQNDGTGGVNWSELSDTEKRALASTYETVFAAKFDPTVFSADSFSEAEFNDLMRNINYGMTGVNLER